MKHLKKASPSGKIGSSPSRCEGEEDFFSHSSATFFKALLLTLTDRTIILITLIGVFFDTTSVILNHSCDGSFLASLTLPCGRDMWRASTGAEWEKAYKAKLDSNSGKKCLTYGDLMQFYLREEGSLNPWLSQLDEFGTLVMAAASFQSER